MYQVGKETEYSTFTLTVTTSEYLYFSNLVIPFHCIPHSSALSHNTNVNPLTSTKHLQHSTYKLFQGVQNITTHWQIDMSKKVLLYAVIPKQK